MPVLQQIVKSYVEPGSQHDGVDAVDWLAVARLLRRTYQVMYIYRDGGFAYPLTDEPYLSEVRRGQHAYDVVMNNVSRMIQQLPVLAKRALHVPETCDVEWWNDWLYRTMLREPMPKPGTNEGRRLGLPVYDPTKFGRSGDKRTLELEALPVADRRQAIYGVAAD